MSKPTFLPSIKSGLFLSTFATLLAVAGMPLAVAQDADDEEIENIVVTGSYIKRDQSNMASPIQIMDSDTIADIGARTLPDLVNTLTINTGAQVYANNLDQGRNAGTTNINLRGLGESSTLVLLNSTRNALTPAVNGNGDQYVNLSVLVPMIAVERVEILKDGASALYGSDAVAGVVNFITRDTFEGLEMTLQTASNEHGGDELQFGLILGGRHERGNFMAAFEFMEVDPVTNAERSADYGQTRNSITGFGMPSSIVNFGLPGPPLVLPDPMCDAVGAQNPRWGPDTSHALVFESFLCRLQYGYYGHVISDEQRMQGFMSASYEFADSAEFFGEMAFANNEITIGSVPTQPVSDPVYVPESHPDLPLFAAGGGCCGDDPNDIYARGSRLGPTGEREEQWWGRVLGAETPQNADLKPFEAWRAKGGLRGQINESWDYMLSYAYSINETEAVRREAVKAELQAALYGVGGPGRNETFRFAWENRDLNSPEMMDQIIGFYGYKSESTQKVFDGIVSGEFGSMGGGPIGAAFGVQYREDTLEYDYNDLSEQFVFSFFIGGADFVAELESTAVFGELAFPFTDDFELNVAVRYEEIDVGGGSENTTDPKISALFTPTDEWSFRASWGTSFRMPSLFSQGGSFFDAGAGNDPLAGGGAGAGITFRWERATDPARPLVPQEADTWNIGVTYAGDNGLTTSLDYWSFEYDGYITYESPSAVLATAPNGPQVLRDPGGNVIQVTSFASNAGFLNTSGIDFNISYAIDTSGGGTWTPFLEMTYMLEYEMDDPSWGPLDALGWANRHNIGAPAIEGRANLGLDWAFNNNGANIIARYIDGYLSDESDAFLGGAIVTTDSSGNTILDTANFRPVDSVVFIDAQYSYRFEDLFGGDSDAVFRIGGRNLADETAPAFFGTAGYDERVHDPRGRYLYAALTLSF